MPKKMFVTRFSGFSLARIKERQYVAWNEMDLIIKAKEGTMRETTFIGAEAVLFFENYNTRGKGSAIISCDRLNFY